MVAFRFEHGGDVGLDMIESLVVDENIFKSKPRLHSHGQI